MKLNVAVQMDPIERINIPHDALPYRLSHSQLIPPDKLSLRGEWCVDTLVVMRSASTARWANRAASRWRNTTSSCCDRIRRSISPTSPRRIFSSGFTRRRWW